LPRIAIALLLSLGVWLQAAADTYSFSAPPELPSRESRQLYGPMLDLLRRETGHVFQYVHPGSHFGYQRGLSERRYDLILDPAHFAAWRLAAGHHVLLARAREDVRFVVIALKQSRVYSREDLIGRPLCAGPPPELGTVAVLQQFDSPFQVPGVEPVPDPLDRVQGLLSGACAGAVLARSLYDSNEDIRRVAGRLKIVAQTSAFPDRTLTADIRVPVDVRNAIRTILLSRAGGEATARLRDRLANAGNFVAVEIGDYEGLETLLRDYPGFQ